MKRILQILLIILPVSMCYADFDVPHVVVYGTAETEVTPDELHWNLAVKTQGATVQEVSTNHTKEVAAVLKYLTKSGVPGKKVKTSRMQLRENFVYRNKSRVKEGYFAHTSIQFLITDFAAYLTYWKDMSEFENLTIDSVTFAISDRIVIQNNTRIVAVQKARSKAEALAEALDAQLHEPLLIEEVGLPGVVPRNAMLSMERGVAADVGSISPGQETVRAQVKTVFRISQN